MPRGPPPTLSASRSPSHPGGPRTGARRMTSPQSRGGLPPRSSPAKQHSRLPRKNGHPMSYSTLAARMSPPKLLPTLALTRMNSFDSAAALLKSGLDCVTDEIFPVPGTDDAGAVDAQVVAEEAVDAKEATECDYDTNPTQLYLLVQNKQWDRAIKRASSHPTEAATWVSRKEADGFSLRWRLLPLHAAIVFQSPPKVIAALLGAYGDGAMCRDDQGKLPIHLCFRKDTDEEVLSLLLQAYPEGLYDVDDKGRTAMMLARNSNSEKREGWMRLLEMFAAQEGARGPTEVVEDRIEEPSSPVEVTLEERAPVPTSEDTPRTKAKGARTATKPRMDEELVERLHHQREKVDSVRRPVDPEGMNIEERCSEEATEIEYTDGADGTAMVVVGPEKDIVHTRTILRAVPRASDAALLQKFRAQRRHRTANPTADPNNPMEEPIAEGSEEQQLSLRRSKVPPVEQAESRDASESGGRSIVDMAPPSLREQMRVRIERRNKPGAKQATSFQDVRQREVPLRSSAMDAAGSKSFDTQELLAAPESDEVTISSSICSSTDGKSVGGSSVKSLGDHFSLKEGRSWTSELGTTAEERNETLRDAERPKNESPSNDVTPKKTNASHPSIAKAVDERPDDDSVLRLIEKMRDQCGDEHPKAAPNDVATGELSINKDSYFNRWHSRDRSAFSLDDDEAEHRASMGLSGNGAASKIGTANWKLGDGPEIYASMTASTAEMTEVPSRSYEDGSLSEVYTSRVGQAKSGEADLREDDLSTPKLLMRLENLRNKSFSASPTDASEKSEKEVDDELATPNLMKKAERFFSNDVPQARTTRDSSTPASAVETAAQSDRSSTSTTQSKFDQLMAKYEVMSQTSLFFEADARSLPSVPSIRRKVTKAPFSGVPRDDHLDSTTFRHRNHNTVECFNVNEPRHNRTLPGKCKAFNGSPLSGVMVQPSQSQDSRDACFVTIPKTESTDSDAVSTLSRTTAGYTTIGSVSFSSEKSAEISSYVQSVVHDVVAKEVGVAGSIKKELEDALKSKRQLERRVKILMQKSDEQSLQLRVARKEKKLAKDKFSREMEIHLTRKAAELKSCIELAMSQAEESKRRAVELAKRDMEKEVALLRTQLDAVRANGVPVDTSLQNALGLVESNQRALREAAENDAKSALEMKNDIEQSFVSAVGEFEAWSDRQLEQMERKWESKWKRLR